MFPTLSIAGAAEPGAKNLNLIAVLPLIDAIEVFNARCVFKADNARALAFAQQHNKLCAVGSDAHYRLELGHAVLRMPQSPNTAAELLAGVAQAEVCLSTLISASTYAEYVGLDETRNHAAQRKNR